MTEWLRRLVRLLGTHRWLEPPWQWSLQGGVSVLLLVAGIGLLINRVDSLDLNLGGTDPGFTLSITSRQVGLPEPGVLVEGAVKTEEAISGISTCSLVLDVPGVEGEIITDTSLLAEDGSFEVLVPQDDFVGATMEAGSITTECDIAGDEVSFPPVESGGS